MIAYKYDKETLEYLNIVQEAQLDIIATKMYKREIYLCPANATFTAPLSAKQDYAVIYDKDNDAWKYIVDYRGKKAYNDTGITIIDYIGELQGSDKLLTEEQIAGIEDGTLIWQDGEIVPKPGPTVEEQIAELERQIEILNTKMLRDIIVLNDENATEEEKAEAQTYFNTKLAQKQELVDQINELKDNDNDNTEETVEENNE